MANDDQYKRLEELQNSGEWLRYKNAAPLIGELRANGFNNKEIKNIMWGIAAESRWKPNIVEKGDSKGGNGLIQLTGDANRAFYSKRLNEYIKENNLNYKNIDLVANRRQLDKDMQMQAVLARMFFQDRKKHLGASNYEQFETVHRAFAPKYETAEQRIERLNEEGWRYPEDEDLFIHAPAVEPQKPNPLTPAPKKAPSKPVAVPVSSIKSKINKDGTLDTTPPSR